MNSLKRIRRLRDAVAETADDPHAHATAQQLAGQALVANALRRRAMPIPVPRTRTTVGTAVFIMIVGGLFAFLGGIAPTDGYKDGVTVTGKVIGVRRSVSSSSSGRSSTVTCSQEVTYTVKGSVFQVTSRFSSSDACESVGEQVKVSYRPAEPAAGRVLPGTGTKIAFKLMSLAGLGILIGGATSLAVLVYGAVTGSRWAREGSRELESHPHGDATGVAEHLAAAWQGPGGVPTVFATSGGADGFDTGAADGAMTPAQLGEMFGGMFGALRGNANADQQPDGGAWGVQPPAPGQMAGTQGAVAQGAGPAAVPGAAPGPVVPPAPQGPPPGWYRDPAGSPAMRWWDGARWTEHTR